MEYIAHLRPATNRWRVLLFVISLSTAVGAWLWLMDPATSRNPFLDSLWQHPLFACSSICLIILFFIGIHKRVVAPSIIVGRLQTVLDDFNMSCDEVTLARLGEATFQFIKKYEWPPQKSRLCATDYAIWDSLQEKVYHGLREKLNKPTLKDRYGMGEDIVRRNP